MFHSGSGALAQRFTRLDAAAPQRAGVMVTTSAEERVTWMIHRGRWTPSACSTAEQEDQTTRTSCPTLISRQRPLQGHSGDEPYDRPDAAQPFAAPPHTSDQELGSSTAPAALVNTGERHSGNAPPHRRWSGDHPDRELDRFSQIMDHKIERANRFRDEVSAYLKLLDRPPGSRTHPQRDAGGMLLAGGPRTPGSRQVSRIEKAVFRDMRFCALSVLAESLHGADRVNSHWHRGHPADANISICRAALDAHRRSPQARAAFKYECQSPPR